MKQERIRYNGIDVIKVIAIILVPVLHFYNNYGFGQINMLHIGNLIQIMIRWISFSCIGLFLMSSGYLLSNKKLSKKYYYRIFDLLLVYLVAIGISHTVRNHFSYNYLDELLLKFFRFDGYFWYVAFYVCFYSIVPYLNMASEKLDKRGFNILILNLIIISALPVTINSMPRLDGRKILFLPGILTVIWPATYYYIGAYFKKFEPEIKKHNCIIYFFIALLWISIINFVYSKHGPACFTGGGYGNIFSVIITTCIFGFFYKVRIKNKISSSIMKFISSLTFETYLSLSMSDILTKKIMSTF